MPREWRELPAIENPDLEAIRKLAVEVALDMQHHEVAIESPFEAEMRYQAVGWRLIELVGWPGGWTEYVA